MERFVSDKITSEELSILDNNSEWLGISKLQLMECAGFSFSNYIKDHLDLNSKSKILIFCGLGNNGGDGFVIARHLASFNIPVSVFLVGIPDKINSNEAIHNWKILSSLEYLVNKNTITDSKQMDTIQELFDDMNSNFIIIDALLGTGIKGKLREPIASCIRMINHVKENAPRNLKVISVDVPSGMDPDTGKVSDNAVHSDLVITFHKPKSGLSKKSKYINELIVKSIGIPLEATIFVGKGDLLPALKKRKKDNHKGQFGKILIIGGSKNYSGAPAYAALTAINFGCDLVITFTPSVVGDVIRSYSPNMIVRSSKGEWLTIKAYDEVSKLIDWADTILIGPGMGLEKETEELFVRILEKLNPIQKKLVLDADALKLVKNHLDLIKGKEVILTPHEGELKIIKAIDLPKYDEIEKRGDITFKLAKEINSIVLLKGPYDYISDGHSLKINKTGCPEMSIGGTGDVLAGLCASFLTTDNTAFKSACSAVFLNGYLGQYCLNNVGPRFTATDMIKNLNNCIKSLQK
ncbi:MAG: NAD(P)H-hydrate dehydratase [Promethearchaeota archaeon]|nr:MAG: NAD(P)H-hydrate dehydratase [Candidatus Lokiarchaeota archaeon]